MTSRKEPDCHVPGNGISGKQSRPILSCNSVTDEIESAIPSVSHEKGYDRQHSERSDGEGSHYEVLACQVLVDREALDDLIGLRLSDLSQ